jgi:hypothetical protein
MQEQLRIDPFYSVTPLATEQHFVVRVTDESLYAFLILERCDLATLAKYIEITINRGVPNAWQRASHRCVDFLGIQWLAA